MKRLLKLTLAVAVGGGTLAASAAFAETASSAAVFRDKATSSVQASPVQAAPSVPAAIAPYCVNTYPSGVEPITLVKINEINNTSSASSTTAHEDFTATIGTLRPGATYAVTMKSNTGGAFAHGHVLYVDWNQNNDFTDAGEGYFIGSITNSTGTDALSATANITVPAGATLGNTRLRAMTRYNVTALSGLLPCNAAGYGQSEDYTVTIDPNAPVPPSLSAAFAPANGAVGASSQMTLTLGNTTATSNALTADFTNTLPAGLAIAATPNASTTCSGTVSTTANSITLANGASIPGGGCAVKVDVSAAAPGIYVNAIAAGALKTTMGEAGAAQATYQATAPGYVNYAVGFEAPDYTAAALNGQKSWYASVAADWNVATANPGAGAQHARGKWTTDGTGTSFMLSPTQLKGTTDYSLASAKLYITVAGTGATWDFAPQDPSAGSVITRVRFLKDAGNKIQVLDPNGGGTGVAAYVDTTATWTAGAYFDLKVIAKRSDSTYKVCVNGTQIHAGTGFAGNVANVAIIGNKGTGTANNVLDVDDVVVDNTNDGNCSAAPTTYTVTPSVTGSGSISPNTAQTVNSGDTKTFTLSADTGNHLVDVTGTCGGTLTGTTSYTTNAVTADCTVVANFAVDAPVTYTVTPSVTGSGSISPNTAQTVNSGDTKTFTLSADTGNHLVDVTGTCGGTLTGTTSYTTNAVTADCTVIANFAADAGNPNIVCHNNINHTLAATTSGTSFNWTTGVVGDEDPTPPTGGPYPYDMNIWNSSGLSAYWSHSPTISAAVAPSTSSAAYSVLHAGDVVGASSIWSRTAGAMTTFKAGVDGYLGVRFDCSSIGGTTCYGYAHFTTTAATGYPAVLVDSCFDKSGADITIGAGAGGAPSVAKAFSPAQVLTNADSTATITLTNPGATAATLTAALVDTLPNGLVATAASTTCGGSVSFTAGSITLASGATIPAGSCKITATVHSAAESSYTNTIHAGDLQTSAGSNAADASATLIVSNTLPFPQPYCSVSFPSNVEPITRVALSGVDNPSSATVNGSPALENFLSVAGGALSRTGVYGATVEGNTDGNYTAKIMVYIDWNQNGTFDAGESFALSDLVNSTGADGKQSTGDITVPADALLGATRMRVIKKFSSVPDACNAAGYGQAEDYTVVVDANPPPQPSADVTPFSFTMTAEEGASATDTMVVHNTAAGRLTFDIKRALPDSRALPNAIDGLLGKASANTRNAAFNDVVKLRDAGMLEQLRRSTSTKSLGMKGHPIELAAGQFSQMIDNSPESLNGVACPSGGTSWWRRFYFSEHAGVGASTRISQVTIGTEDGTSRTATINVYSIPHGVTVDTIPLDQLTLLGSGTGAVGGTLTTSTIELDDPVDIADTSAVDLVVEYNVASSAGFFPAGNSTTQTHPTFISSTTCSIADPTDAANVGAGFPDFHIIMIVDYGDVTPPGTGCGSPSNVAWLSATPKTGTINGIGTKNVTVKANAASLTAGTYGGLMCVNTNDLAHPQFEIPVTFTVTPNIANDTIFKNGFDGAPPVDPDVVTGTINLPVQADGDGSTLDFVTGLYGTYDAARVDDVNLYDYGDGTLTVYWYGDASALSVGGVVDGGGAEFAVLHSGDVIGPSSTILATSKKLANWTTGADGYLGVAFENETTGALNYGYIHLTTTSPLGFPAQVLEYAYNKAGNAITIP